MTWNDVRQLSADDVLTALGLRRRREVSERILPALGLFAAGLLVGAGLGVLFAPRPGAVLRGDIRRRLAEGRERMAVRADEVTETDTRSALG